MLGASWPHQASWPPFSGNDLGATGPVISRRVTSPTEVEFARMQAARHQARSTTMPSMRATVDGTHSGVLNRGQSYFEEDGALEADFEAMAAQQAQQRALEQA